MIHVYPGMGATRQMYSGAWDTLPNARFHNWPCWNGETTITQLANRLINKHRIEAGDTVIGSSLGGIVACEISNRLPLKQLILIGSAINKTEIAALLRVLHPLIDYLPIDLTRISSGSIPLELSQMFTQSEPNFIRAMTKAIFNWGGLNSDVPCTRIHGTKDRVIPIPESIDLSINGGHLIAMSHPQECITAITNIMSNTSNQ